MRALESAVNPSAVKLGEPLTKLDLAAKIASTPKGEYRYQRLVSSVPFPHLLQLAGVRHDPAVFTWNQVLVFNLGFDRKGLRGVCDRHLAKTALCFQYSHGAMQHA